jgi:ECF transporter S component (folate family)
MIPKVKKVALAGLLLAVLIVLARFVSVQWAVLRVSFGYIPMAMAGWLLGPVWCAVLGALGDVLGMLILPKGGAYFPGFTVSEALVGLAYGLFLYNKPVDKRMWLRLGLCLAVTCLVINLFLGTFWLSIYIGKGFLALLPGRVLAQAVKLPVELVTLYFVMKMAEVPVNRYLVSHAEPEEPTVPEGE